MPLSRIDLVTFRGRKIYVKRDDLIDTCLSGNKYRKLYQLINTPSNTYTKLISYGGAQSNAMYSLACLCQNKGWEFHYYTKNLPQFLKEGLEGNLELAVKAGMIVHEVEHLAFDEKVEELKKIKEDKTLMVSQGAADTIAKEGITLLAQEINEWKIKNKMLDLKVVLPSGTGTTALYLNEALDDDISLYTSVLVGDKTYQEAQWKKLSNAPYPSVFSSDKKRRFAKPYAEYLEIHQELYKVTGILFDLIYAPLTWMQLLENFNEDDTVLYIHTGGVSGNDTMLERYKYLKRRKR